MVANAQKFGWAPGEGKISFGEMRRTIDGFLERGIIQPFKLYNRTAYTDSVAKRCAWDDCAKVGIEYKNIPQEIGDCVSWGMRNVCNLTQITEIALGERSAYHPVFAPYSFWCGRMTPEGGNGRLNSPDGSLGSWQAAATKVYGCLREDFDGCPPYSGSIAKKWGSMRSLDTKFVEEGKRHSFKTIGQVTTMEQLKDALRNGYWCTIASMQGYRMEGQVKGDRAYFVGSDSWPHQMSVVGIDTLPDGSTVFFILNQWGPNAHGPQPLGFAGGMWVTEAQMQRHAFSSRDAELFVFSEHVGYDEAFPERQWYEPW